MSRNRRYLEHQPLGLDEIMIVNPGPARAGLWPITPAHDLRQLGRSRTLFLGDDGVVYALYGPEEPVRSGDWQLGSNGRFSRLVEPSSDDLPEDDLFEVERVFTYLYEPVYLPLARRRRPARGHRGRRRR